MTYKVIHNALVNKVQTQAICNCRMTARAVIWSTSYFRNVSIFLRPWAAFRKTPVPIISKFSCANMSWN